MARKAIQKILSLCDTDRNHLNTCGIERIYSMKYTRILQIYDTERGERSNRERERNGEMRGRECPPPTLLLVGELEFRRTSPTKAGKGGCGGGVGNRN